MAESLADRLKRIAAEKKAASLAEVTSEVTSDGDTGTGKDNGTEVRVASKAPDNSNVPDSDASLDGPKHSSSSDHPLVMEFAELSQALDSKDPEFKIILRKIHQQLGKDPDLVTQMTEQQIQQVVTGMIVFANAEIVAPAKAKTEKAAITAAKKKVISADDL